MAIATSGRATTGEHRLVLRTSRFAAPLGSNPSGLPFWRELAPWRCASLALGSILARGTVHEPTPPRRRRKHDGYDRGQGKMPQELSTIASFHAHVYFED